MKRFTVALATLFFIAGCTAPREEKAAGETLVVASFYPVQELATSLLHDLPGFKIRSVAPASAGCMHNYSMTPADLSLLRQADIVIGQGYGLDAFLFSNEVRSANPSAHFIDLGLSDPIPMDLGHHEHDHHDHGDDHLEAAPHVWVSPMRVARHATLLTDSLAVLFPSHSDTIRARGSRLESSLHDLHRRYTDVVQSIGNKHIAAMHSSFDVLAQDIGLEMDLVVQVDPVAAPGPRTLDRVTNELRNGTISILLTEPQMDGALEKSLSERAGVALVRLNTGVGSESVSDLLSLHEENLRTLTQALRGEE